MDATAKIQNIVHRQPVTPGLRNTLPVLPFLHEIQWSGPHRLVRPLRTCTVLRFETILLLSHIAMDLTFFMFGIYVCIELDNCKANCSKIGTVEGGATEEIQYAHLRKCLISYTRSYMWVDLNWKISKGTRSLLLNIFFTTSRYVKDFSRLFSWNIFGENMITIIALSTSIAAVSIPEKDQYFVLTE